MRWQIQLICKKMGLNIKKLLFAAFCVLGGIGLIGFFFGLFQYKNAEESLRKAESVVLQYQKTIPTDSETEIKSISADAIIDIERLQKENSDVIGYIEIPDTVISYPVMQSAEKDYYLNHDFYGKRSVYGSIYIDPACYEDGIVTLLYGHNMKNGSMFGSLKQYLNSEYLKEHSEIYYTTKDGLSVYQICAIFHGMTTDENLTTCLIPYTNTEFDRLKSIITESGNVYENFESTDHLLILSTCTGSQRKRRLFVVARRTETFDTEGFYDSE